MPRIKNKSVVIWSSEIEKDVPFGSNCVRCRKDHDALTKTCVKCLDYCAKHQKKNKEKNAERDANYRKKNSDKIKSQKAAYKLAHKEDIAATYAANAAGICAHNNARRNTREGKVVRIHESAKTRGIEIAVSDEDLMDMTDLACAYCGSETVDQVKRNGIDRLNYLLGYIPGNCVSCCGTCNIMKGALDPFTFVERCAQISDHIIATEYWSSIRRYTFNAYKNKATKLGHVFELTQEQYDRIRSNNCTYCDRPSTSTHSNGIDRSDSSIGYVFENCISACWDCNIAKNNSSPSDFIAQCIVIASRIHDFPDIPRQINSLAKRPRNM
jgi:hypothetical protein